MGNITPENLTDGCAQTDLLTAKLRVEGCDGKPLITKIVYLANILVQADGTIDPGDKTAWDTVATWLATESNVDKIIKKY